MLPSDNKRLWLAIRQCSRYWFARIILGKNSLEAMAMTNHLHPAETQAIFRLNKRRRYHRDRAAGMTWREHRAKAFGTTVEEAAKKDAGYRKKWREKWGGDPSKPGTEAHHRWMLATK